MKFWGIAESTLFQILTWIEFRFYSLESILLTNSMWSMQNYSFITRNSFFYYTEQTENMKKKIITPNKIFLWFKKIESFQVSKESKYASFFQLKFMKCITLLTISINLSNIFNYFIEYMKFLSYIILCMKFSTKKYFLFRFPFAAFFHSFWRTSWASSSSATWLWEGSWRLPNYSWAPVDLSLTSAWGHWTH